MAEGIGRGDAVFLPAFTYTATAEVPLVLGATPVFVDVDPRTFQIDPAHLADRIAAVRAAGKLRPRAVIGVDLFGQAADWPAINAIAAREGLFTLDDCAQSFGATLHGRPLGTLADATIASFFPSKALGAYGDGGAIFTEARRPRRAVSQPAHPWRGHHALRGPAHRHERPPGFAAGRRAAGEDDRVPRGACDPRAHRPHLRPAPGQRGGDPRTRARQHQRLGDLRDPAARGRFARCRPGAAEGAGRAHRHLLSSPAAPAARLSRPPRRLAAAGQRGASRTAFWRCRSTPICPRRRSITSAGRSGRQSDSRPPP